MQGWFNIQKSMLSINHINGQKQQNHIIISLDTEEASDKIQHSCMSVIISKLATVPNFMKNILKTPQANIMFNGEKREASPLRSGARQRCPPSSALSNTRLEVLASVIR